MIQILLHCLIEEEIELLINKVYMVANYENETDKYKNLLEILIQEREKRKEPENNHKNK